MKSYDYIVVGSGMGGSASAYALTKAGFSVLLLEAGQPLKNDDLDWDGLEVLVKGRYKSDRPVWVKQYNQKTHTPQPQDEVLGGKTVLYGGAAFRLREEDFFAWNLTYQDFAPWYDKAEELLEVHGQQGLDSTLPTSNKDYPYPSAPLSAPALRIQNAALQSGFNPFPIPIAINTHNQNRTVCILCNTCDGFPCKIQAKNDAMTCFLAKADTDLLHIETGFVADCIEINGSQAKSVIGFSKQTNAIKKFTASKIILSCGAIESAAILLRSNIADPSGIMGKNLMRHCNTVVGCLFPFQTNPDNAFHKQIAITDLYHQDRSRSGYATGVIQDIYMPPKNVLGYFVPFGIKSITKLLRGYIQNLLCVAEDQPQLINQVSLSNTKNQYGMTQVKVDHQYHKDDYRRNQILVQAAKQILKKAGGLGFMVRKIDTFSHAVGTLRFGENPKASVLDLHCKVHGVDNLFVIDGSFMPTSGGVNPSLTIAANALRVCDAIAKEKA